VFELVSREKNELVRIRKIEKIECSGFYLSKKDRDNLKKYKKNKKYSEEDLLDEDYLDDNNYVE
jgi:hypothetical protein